MTRRWDPSLHHACQLLNVSMKFSKTRRLLEITRTTTFFFRVFVVSLPFHRIVPLSSLFYHPSLCHPAFNGIVYRNVICDDYAASRPRLSDLWLLNSSLYGSFQLFSRLH